MDKMTFRLLLLVVALLALPAGRSDAKPGRPLPPPSPAEAHALCRWVAARGPAIESVLVRDGILDANNDGVPDHVSVGRREGTMGGEALEFRARGMSNASAPVEITEEGFQGGAYLPLGVRWLPYRGRVYVLNFESEGLRHVSYLSIIDAKNIERLVCDFDNVEHERLVARSRKDADLCGAVTKGKVNYASVSDEPDPDLTTERWATHVAGSITIDFRNAGRPASLALLSFESGAGRGCSFDYFDQVADKAIASAGATHVTLMKLQAVEPGQENTTGPCGGGVPRWFTYRGQVFLDSASKSDAFGIIPFHDVKLVRNGRMEARCTGTFAVRQKVRTMGDGFK
jgi:hypothetical protein